MQIFSSDQNDNSDLCLKMCCIEYMRNFFNDHAFKVNAFASLVPPVVKMGSNMLTKCAANSEAINEILDLFRFIVDKYACMSLSMEGQQTVNDFLIATLQQVWSHFMGVIGDNKELAEMDLSEVYGEESIVLHSIVRILNHIVVRVKLSDLSEDSAMDVLSTAMAIST